jgi:hypothetical protein
MNNTKTKPRQAVKDLSSGDVQQMSWNNRGYLALYPGPFLK